MWTPNVCASRKLAVDIPASARTWIVFFHVLSSIANLCTKIALILGKRTMRIL